MENVTPTLILLWDVKRALEKGFSVSNGIQYFIKRDIYHEFAQFVRIWLAHFQTDKESLNTKHLNPTRRYLLSILEHGLKGQAILESLKAYEIELIMSCEDEIQSHIAKLPLVLLVPLMCFIFPSIMMLLIWPALKMFQM
ncbi:MAG: hypothetical protein WA160_08270 [Pseudobdellovibrio sp.]